MKISRSRLGFSSNQSRVKDSSSPLAVNHRKLHSTAGWSCSDGDLFSTTANIDTPCQLLLLLGFFALELSVSSFAIGVLSYGTWHEGFMGFVADWHPSAFQHFKGGPQVGKAQRFPHFMPNPWPIQGCWWLHAIKVVIAGEICLPAFPSSPLIVSSLPLFSLTSTSTIPTKHYLVFSHSFTTTRARVAAAR